MRDRLRDGRRWLGQAEVDLEAARFLATRFPALACFHSQQAAEKALKAILYASGERPVIGHSLRELGERVEAVSGEYRGLRGDATKLDRFYIATRYPNGLPEGSDPSEAFDEADARWAIEIARQVLDHARSYVDSLRG